MNELDAEIEELKTKLAALRTQKRREYVREYLKRPDVHEKRREYQREYQREYWKRPDVHEKRREYQREYWKRPDVHEKRREYQREYQREYRKRPEVKLRRRLRKAGLSKDVINAEVARLLKNEAAE